ncbi:MAG TPA: glycogen/starch/alpha-glucan phosphorylase [Chitinivibrionales bacterium]|nr:glycogen/starch/alpha-glucan phosphorylase [Chitinivibrionales bacterium]
MLKSSSEPLKQVDDKNNKNWSVHFKGMSRDNVRLGFLNNLEYCLAKDKYSLTAYSQFLSLAFTVRDRLIERWIISKQQYHENNVKRVYYMSMEFLMGRLLSNNIVSLEMFKSCTEAMKDLGLDIEDIVDQEHDAGLGNGGLGRLAACFLDSMASLELPAVGYGILYEFGIFNQRIINGSQVEFPEQWLQNANPWVMERPEYKVRIKYYGKTLYHTDEHGKQQVAWVDTDEVIALPFDVPVPGFGNNTVNTLRLWSARAAHEFNFEYFNSGDYIGACEDKLTSENISKVLYPNDNNHSGKELRLKQQHFFTSASLQDIIRRYRSNNKDFHNFADKVAIQLNDTHPAIAIVELMRLFLDEYGLTWDESWDIAVRTFAYTNHTLMPEALEKWPVSLMKNLLPRHMEIIYEINSKFLRQVSYKYPGDIEKLRDMSLIEEGPEPKVRMAYLAIVGSHSVNGVSELHTKLLANGLVKNFYDMWPEKFNNKTNGITQRRWLYTANQSLSSLISSRIGSGWIKDLMELKKLAPFADDPEFRKQWHEVKLANKKRFAQVIKKWENIRLNPDTMFDVQVKRFHEYKRQTLNILHCISMYSDIKAGNKKGFVPRTMLFAGKAAPGYYMAKLMIKFINNVAGVINGDPDTNSLLAVHFIPNYRVSLAEFIMPAADVSEQISTAGTEASGTGNMKFGLNGAITIGTMDGANIEMWEEVGDENIFIFGLRTNEVSEVRAKGYNPWDYYHKNEKLRKVMDLISMGFFSPEDPQLFRPIYDSLLNGGDRYMVMADFDSYVQCQKTLADAYSKPDKWAKMSILNVANMGRFSSDRTIQQYADDIWGVKPIRIELDS